MWIKQFIPYTLDPDFSLPIDELESLLDGARYKPAGDRVSETTGWVPVVYQDGALFHHEQETVQLRLCHEVKILPESVITEKLMEQVRQKEDNGQKIGSKERMRMKENIRFELLPQAFSKLNHIHGYFDMARKELIVATSSFAKAELFITKLRETIGTLPLTPAKSRNPNAQRVMTEWVTSKEMPESVRFGSSITLVSEADKGKASFRNQDLDSAEIQECLQSGKSVNDIELVIDEKASLVITSDLRVSKVKPETYLLESMTDEMEGDAEFFIAAKTVREIRAMMDSWFGAEPISQSV